MTRSNKDITDPSAFAGLFDDLFGALGKSRTTIPQVASALRNIDPATVPDRAVLREQLADLEGAVRDLLADLGSAEQRHRIWRTIGPDYELHGYPVAQVFNFWLRHQEHPGRCRLTDGRKRLITSALRDYDVAEVCALVAYAYEADEPGPRFWRGENNRGRTYLDLTNLLSDAKRLPGRIEAALEWVDRKAAGETETVVPQDDATQVMQALINRVPGQRFASEPQQGAGDEPGASGAGGAATTPQRHTEAPRRTRGPRWE